jgi:hypothetical protein
MLKKPKAMMISGQPSLAHIVMDQKQLENAEYLIYFGSMITNEARCAREVQDCYEPKAAFNKKNSFHQRLGLKFREATSKELYSEYGFIWC